MRVPTRSGRVTIPGDDAVRPEARRRDAGRLLNREEVDRTGPPIAEADEPDIDIRGFSFPGLRHPVLAAAGESISAPGRNLRRELLSLLGMEEALNGRSPG